MDLLAAMRVYLRVVERGSLSAAARDLGMGQPAVSERIAQLERRLQTRLLDRTTRSIRVTDAGQRFHERARLAVEAMDEALALPEHPLRGTLRIAAPHGVGETLVPPLLLAMQEQHAGLTIDLVLNDRFVDPVAEGVDLSLRIGRVGEGGFVARRLGGIARAILASPAYLARHGAPASPEELDKHPFIRIDSLTSDERLTLLDAQGAPLHASIRTAWRTNHWRPLQTALLAGAGIGVLQLPVCADVVRSGALVPVLPAYRLPPRDMHAIYPATRHLPAKTRVFLELLRERLSPLLQD